MTDHVLSDASDVIVWPFVDFDKRIISVLLLRQMFVSANAAVIANINPNKTIKRFIFLPLLLKLLICDVIHRVVVQNLDPGAGTRIKIHITLVHTVANRQ